MEYLLYAALMAFVIVGITTAATVVKCENREAAMLTGAILFVVYTLIGWLMMYWTQPVLGLSMTSFYQTFWLWLMGFIVAIVVLGFFGSDSETIPTGTVVLAVAIVAIGIYGVANVIGGVWTSSRAQELANQVKVVTEDTGKYPDTDAGHIVVVPEQVARHNASTAMTDVPNLSTSYEIMQPVLQSVNNHAYWVVGLEPSGYQAYNRINSTIPGFITVDAENPNATAVYHDKDASGETIAMHYYANGWFGMDVNRHVWENGYAGTPIDDWTLEVDDQWRPYWTASTNRLTLNFQHTVPNGVLTVDAQSGDIQHYALGKAPAWLDRIYSAETAKQMLDWWGDYAGGNYGWMFRGPTKRYQVSGDPVLVYTKENYPVWQMELTSINSDVAVQYLALFDGRTSTVRLYHINNLVIDEKVTKAVEDSQKNIRKLTPTHLAIHKINGHMTWVGALVPNGDSDPSSETNMQGVTLVPAGLASINGGDIALGDTMSDALNDYETILSNNGSTKPGEDASGKTAKDVTVDRVSPAMSENGKTVYYFTIQGDAHAYRMAVNPTATGSDLERPFIQSGIKVTFSYIDNGSGRRDVTTYDDLSMNLG